MSDSLNRYFLNCFIEKHLGNIDGKVLNIGGERKNSKCMLSDSTKLKKELDITIVNIDESKDPDVVHDLNVALPFDKNIFDVCICTQVLYYVENFQECFNSIYDSLKPGGMFYLTLPFMYHSHQKEDILRLSRYMVMNMAKNKFELISLESPGKLPCIIYDSLRWIVSNEIKETIVNKILRRLIFMTKPLFLFLNKSSIFDSKDVVSNYYFVFKKVNKN